MPGRRACPPPSEAEGRRRARPASPGQKLLVLLGEGSWLKMRVLTRLAVARGWRAVLVSDCGAEGKGTFSFRGSLGNWLVIFSGRCGAFEVLSLVSVYGPVTGAGFDQERDGLCAVVYLLFSFVRFGLWAGFQCGFGLQRGRRGI